MTGFRADACYLSVLLKKWHPLTPAKFARKEWPFWSSKIRCKYLMRFSTECI